MAWWTKIDAKTDSCVGKYQGEDGKYHKLKDYKLEQIAIINKEVEQIAESTKSDRDKIQDQLNDLHALKALGELKADQVEVVEKKEKELRDALRTETLREIGVSLEKFRARRKISTKS